MYNILNENYMIKEKLFKNILVVFYFTLLFFNNGFSQCKNFARKSCIPKLTPFVFNGQLNNAILNEGDVADLSLTFLGGQSYRIYVCYEEPLKNVEFSLVGNDEKIIFSNIENNYINYWDFTTTSTQQLIVRVKVPKEKSINDMTQTGCVSILVGFKK